MGIGTGKDGGGGRQIVGQDEGAGFILGDDSGASISAGLGFPSGVDHWKGSNPKGK